MPVVQRLFALKSTRAMAVDRHSQAPAQRGVRGESLRSSARNESPSNAAQIGQASHVSWRRRRSPSLRHACLSHHDEPPTRPHRTASMDVPISIGSVMGVLCR